MSVFTRIRRPDLELFLARFDVGGLVDFHGISEGIENTNYFVTTEAGEFVLTLVEQWPAEDMPYFIALASWLAARDFPCARPVADLQGRTLHALAARPAALVQRLPGVSTAAPTLAECEAAGTTLAHLHRCALGFPMRRADQRAMAWRVATAQTLEPALEAADRCLLMSEIRHHQAQEWRGLPRGVVHADLFPDNVLFEGGVITGVIDLYYACDESWIYDLAITVNQWCSGADGRLRRDRALATMRGYHARRALVQAERAAWPAMLRYAAQRFWISRLKDQRFPKDGHLTTVRDPDFMRCILEDRRENEPAARALWDEVTGDS